MRISSLAFANLRRRKSRACFLMAGIGIGVGAVVALFTLTDSIRKEIGDQLDRFGANIVVAPYSDSFALEYGGVTAGGVNYDVHELHIEDVARIREIPYRARLSTIAPKLLGAVDVEGQKVLLAGVDFPAELALKKWWSLAGRKPRDGEEVLVGYEVALALGVIDDSPAAHGAHGGHHHDHGRHIHVIRESIRIAGQEHSIAAVIAETGGPEDRMVFGALEHVQALLGKPGALSLIEISALCKDCPVEDIVGQIALQVPHAKVSAIQKAVRVREDAVERLAQFSAAVSAVVLAIGGLMVFTSMMGSVVERTKEIGVMRAIGFRRKHVVKVLIIEIATVSAAAGFAGWAGGSFASWLALPYFTEPGSRLELVPWLPPLAVVTALLIGILGSAYPALRASRLDPSEAVRHV